MHIRTGVCLIKLWLQRFKSEGVSTPIQQYPANTFPTTTPRPERAGARAFSPFADELPRLGAGNRKGNQSLHELEGEKKYPHRQAEYYAPPTKETTLVLAKKSRKHEYSLCGTSLSNVCVSQNQSTSQELTSAPSGEPP